MQERRGVIPGFLEKTSDLIERSKGKKKDVEALCFV